MSFLLSILSYRQTTRTSEMPRDPVVLHFPAAEGLHLALRKYTVDYPLAALFDKICNPLPQVLGSHIHGTNDNISPDVEIIQFLQSEFIASYDIFTILLNRILILEYQAVYIY